MSNQSKVVYHLIDTHDEEKGSFRYVVVALVADANTDMFHSIDKALPTGFTSKNIVGWAFIYPNYDKANTAYGENLLVAPQYRRQGIASGMYQYIQDQTGLKMTPAKMRTQPGRKFWQNKKFSANGYKYASTQINLPSDLAKKVLAVGASIPDEDLGNDGREDESHITIKYGVDEDEKAVREAIQNFPQFEIVLGSITFFPPRNEDGTPVIVAVELSDELKNLHEVIMEAAGIVKDEFPYAPHVTLVYVKDEETAKKYAGDALKGEKFVATSIMLSKMDGTKVSIPLGGEKFVSPLLQGPHGIRYGSKFSYNKLSPNQPGKEYVQETNGWADQYDRRKGDEAAIPLEEVAPQMFKESSTWDLNQNFSFEDWWHLMGGRDGIESFFGTSHEEAAAEYRHQLLELRNLSFPLPIYRAVNVASLNNIDFTKLGIYWSVNSQTTSHWNRQNEKDIVIEALVEKEDVDWSATLLSRIQHPVEEEITLKKGREIEIIDPVERKTKTATKAQSEYQTSSSGTAQNFMKKFLREFWPDLPVPQLKIVNETWSGLLGTCSWSSENPDTSVIEIQKSATGNPKTLQRTIAHELCHHAEYMLHHRNLPLNELKSVESTYGHHGKWWQDEARKVNARYGQDFVTEVSDAIRVNGSKKVITTAKLLERKAYDR